MRRAAAAAVVVLAALAGCAPSDPAKQADEIASIAAEGALLAHDAGEGSTTSAFTRVHAEALRKNLRKLEPKVEDAELVRLLQRVDDTLEALAREPGDEAGARRLELRLERDAKQAEELAQ